MKYIINQLRSIRENDQVLSVGGDGCAMVQAIRTLLDVATAVCPFWKKQGELEEAITHIEKVINTKYSVYDELDQCIDSLEQEADNND